LIKKIIAPRAFKLAQFITEWRLCLTLSGEKWKNPERVTQGSNGGPNAEIPGVRCFIPRA
jgi:hypothetical protein